MAERETEHRRIVVETPTTRREVERTEAVHHPERSGMSGAALAAIVVGVIALATLIILFMMNQQRTAEETAATQQQPTTTIVQQPAAQQPPVIIEQPATTTTQPVIINNPAAAGGSAPATGNGDSVVQAAVDKRLSEDSTFSGLGITATVLNGKVTLTGIVQNQALKAQVERAIKNIKGVTAVDNQISVG
jgi:hypothetical protein